jgi:hypothetical protein
MHAALADDPCGGWQQDRRWKQNAEKFFRGADQGYPSRSR